MDIQWGVLNNKEEVKKSLAELVGKKIDKILFRHIVSGFTDNVFIATVTTRDATQKYIVKQYIKNWHSKEADFYQEILAKYSFLGAPNLLFTGSNFIILEFLDGKSLSANNINLLKDWIIKKHGYFAKNTKVSNYKEHLSSKVHYLVDKPIKSLELIKDTKFIPDDQKKLIAQAVKLSDYYAMLIKNDISRVPTLEHGDLEPQNIFVTDANSLRVIDWVNVREGSGLFDLNQFFETADELKAKYNRDNLINEFSEKLNILNISQSINEVRILMLLNKINFYISKLLNGELSSPSKNKLTTEILNKYLGELFSLLIKEAKIQPN